MEAKGHAGGSVGGIGNEIPQLPHWFIFLRYAQVVLTLIVFVCCCVALGAVQGLFLGWGAGFSMFTSIYTAIFLAGVLLVPVYAPQFYFKWFILGAESFAVLWWLCSFAGLATWASWLSVWRGVGGTGMTVYGACAAGAAFGAFNWIAFCVSLVFYAIGCHRHRMSKMQMNGGSAYSASGNVEVGSMGPIGIQQPAYQAQPGSYPYQPEQAYPTVPTPAPSQGYQG
ncbi:hypothetical protein TWF696_000113 [Orbilia brochopaga]|uniref:MARVEL domain-containing protein n=1 Tax=Orbilia brochopaga TaxID=3140254 RepID=A0AAV9VCP6_9PEZI